MKSKYILIAVAVIAVVFLVYKFTDLGQGNNKNIDLKKYDNSELGISFEYPEYYLVSEKNVSPIHKQILIVEDNETNKKLLSGEIVGEGPTAITIDFIKSTSTARVESWVKNNSISNYNLKKEESYPITIGGVKGITYAWDGLYQGQNIVTKHKDNVIIFAVTYLTLDDQIRIDYGNIVGSAVLK